VYVDSVNFDGKAHPRSWFAHADIREGGRFVFRLKDKPNEEFGKAIEDRPKSELV